MRRWRCNATANTNRNTRTKGFGVRELRPLGRNSNASETEKKGIAEVAEKEQGQGLAFSLSAPLAFRSLSLRALPCKPIPRQAASGNLRADVREKLCIAQLATVVAEGLFIQVTEQVEQLHADIGSVQLALYQAPEVFHRVRVNIAANVLYGVICACPLG